MKKCKSIHERLVFTIGILLPCLIIGTLFTCFAHAKEGRIVTPLSLGFTYSSQYPANDNMTVHGLRAGIWMGDINMDIRLSPYSNNVEVYGISMGLLTMTDYKVTGLQISGICNTVDTLHGIQMSLFGNESQYAYGGKLALIVNANGYEMYGISIAGLANFFGDNIIGWQCAGLLNFNGNVTGIQTTLGVNASINRYGQMTGMQIAGLANLASNVDGIQMALLFNKVGEDMNGVQVGLVNCAKKVRGVQIGLYNTTDDLQWIQIGLLNSKRGRLFPCIMIGW